MKRIDKPSIAASDSVSIVKWALPPELRLEIREILPRFSEGCIFVKYSRDPGVDDAEVERATKENLEKNVILPWFNPFRRVEVARVLGQPWIEDLYRFPSPKLKVEFLPTSPDKTAAELTPETLYSLFRRYGKLLNVERQPSASPVTPKYAFVEFTVSRNAIMARNCVHGLTVSEEQGGGKFGTTLKITYERRVKFSWLKDWLLGHPRIVIPAMAALLAATTVIIFDPIRTFFIKMRIKSTLRMEESAVWRWIRNQVSKAYIVPFGHHKREAGGFLSTIWEDRKNDIVQLQAWLMENVETFIVIQGPHGSGKRELVLDQVLKNRRYRLVIDCRPIQEARGDSATISATAAQVGYRPVFSWMNSISSFIDLASQGMIGAKAGFSETLDAQLSKILQTTATALKQVALEGQKYDDKDVQLTDDEYLEAHPERRPVVVIDNFLHKAGESSLIYDKIAEWAAALTSSNIAHIVFLTTDVSFSKSLSKALPNQVFRTISLGDCSLEVAKKYVLNHLEREGPGSEDVVSKLNSPQGLRELESCIATLGGRVTDLEFMAHRIKAGESPQHAVNRIVEQSASEVLKIYLLEVNRRSQNWTREQAWYMIKAIAQAHDGAVSYNEILLSDLFKENGEATITALEQDELISISAANGHPHTIKPGKPVYHASFKRLVEDKILRSRLDLVILSQLISKENSRVSKYEDELRLLGKLPKQPSALTPRIQWVLNKLSDAQSRIDKYERESAMLKNILQGEH
ncbi:hypothetical protein VTN00DRAFT_7609 [Thermoascus crustaceus]|uniref:uncharacterized protein n=1 Tax=Thermoascus crustaceus TaxID=5088 RepID=UPI0037424B84